MSERCSECRFFERYEDESYGDCRRFPPSPVPLMTQEVWSYPDPDDYAPVVVWADGWCGEFQPASPPAV